MGFRYRSHLYAFTLISFVPIAPRSNPAQRPTPPALAFPAPLLVDLLTPLNAAKLTAGSLVIAKTRFDWQTEHCVLRTGSVVTGQVAGVNIHSRDNKGSSISVVFDHADCNGHPTPIRFQLFAIVARPELDEGRPMSDREGLLASFAANATGGPVPSLPNSPRVQREDTFVSHSHSIKVPSVIAPGQIFGLSDLTLSPGATVSILSSSRGNLRLDEATRLILVYLPDPVTVASSPEPSRHIADPQPLAPPREATEPPLPLPDETEVCTSTCMLDSGAALSPMVSTTLHLTTSSLGFIPHKRDEYNSLGFESALNFLDADNLLFTYDPHRLRRRFSSGIHDESLRTVRAVLLDPHTLHVKRVADWLVQGEGQYLWAVPDGLLVHIGHHLRLLGPDLAVRHDLPLSAELAFIAVSPSFTRIAIGTTHERYTRENYLQLLTLLKHEPEEDIDVQLFDSSFNLILTTGQTSAQPEPVLSDRGELRIHALGSNRWQLLEYPWDHSERIVATLNSECRPSLTIPLPSAIFVIGCGGTPLQIWYRMLRLDGHTLLKGHGSVDAIEQTATGDNLEDFAIRVVRTHNARRRDQSFQKAELEREEVAVYRATDARRLLEVATTSVSLAEQSYALSPSGRQLAVLSETSIEIYPISVPGQNLPTPKFSTVAK